jgi:hypothetical protein
MNLFSLTPIPRRTAARPWPQLFRVAQNSSSAVSQICSLLPYIAYDGLEVANSQCLRQAGECNSAIQQTECLRYTSALNRYPGPQQVRARDDTRDHQNPFSSEPLRLGTSRGRWRHTAFTLLEVMIACGIFFMATFAILALVAGTVRNARALQRGEVDASMAAAQAYEILKTNRLESGSAQGTFGETYRDFSWNAIWDVDYDGGATNNLLRVEIVVNRRGAHKPVDQMVIWVYDPLARSAYAPGR